MKGFLPKFAELRVGWNEKALFEADFYRICKKLKISVQVMPMANRGYYSTSKGKHFIAIKEGMPELQMLFVMFHEFGHYLMHAPGGLGEARFSGKPKDTREEREADAFAFCALLPLELLSNLTPQELVDVEGYPAWFLMRRLAVYERYGI